MADTVVKIDDSAVPIGFADTGFGEVGAGGAIGPAHWDRFDLLCVHRGRLDLSIDGIDRRRLTRGRGSLLYPDTRFTGLAGPRGARISVQHFRLPDPARPLGWLPGPFIDLLGRSRGCEPVQFDHEPGLESRIRRLVNAAFAADIAPRDDLRACELALLLGHIRMDDARPSNAPPDPREMELRRRLQAHDAPYRLTPDDLAEWVNLSPSRFRVWFRGRFGVSPKHHLMKLRNREVMRRLRETPQPIKAIAADLGFTDAAALHHDFRRFTGSTPSAYRCDYTVHG